jgi:hypothetical protein
MNNWNTALSNHVSENVVEGEKKDTFLTAAK